MHVLFLALGAAATILGALCLYLASPNQQLMAAPWRARPARTGGLFLLALGLPLLDGALTTLAASLAFATLLMLVPAVLPYVGLLAGQARR